MNRECVLPTPATNETLVVEAADLTADLLPSQVKPVSLARIAKIALIAAASLIAAVLIWQGVTASGNPDPTVPHTSPGVAILDVAVLVFREGLECVLVLSAITAGMVGRDSIHRKPIAGGVGVGFLATVATWFIAVGILSDLTNSVSALNLQAATGLLAIVVLLIVMNWFFHKVYWGGWISLHHRRKRDLLSEAKTGEATKKGLLWGLGLLGFASLYREGFEVVLFLQSYRLQVGSAIVLQGALLGLFFTSIIAVLNFVAHRKLPYRKMLILTGVMLGAVLLVMVGEQAQEMQLAHWIPKTDIAVLVPFCPDWVGTWFALFPTVETIASQGIAFVVVVGSYLLYRNLASSSSEAVAA